MDKVNRATNAQALARRESKKTSKVIHNLHFVSSYCKACGLCVDICPTGTLQLYDDPENKWGVSVTADQPEYCIGCKMCETQCPDFAIFIN